jgi:hypothetical protein
MTKTAKRVHVRQEFLFLNRLRESGATNMFGAAPYLEDEFGLERRDARFVLAEWMRWVESNPENRDA